MFDINDANKYVGLRMSKRTIIGCTPNDIVEYGFSHEMARKVCTWVYRKRAKSFDEMLDIPKQFRVRLSSQFVISVVSPLKNVCSADGTEKFLFKTPSGNSFEAAYMPTSKRSTLCISTQSGCRMGCSFCHTGSMGFRENLNAGEIVGQVLSVSQVYKVNRIVIMGMGEPLDNYVETFKALHILTSSWGLAFGASHITLSTVGIFPHLETLIAMKKCNVAVSLHSPYSEQRAKLMPSERLNTISSVVEFLRNNPVKKPLRLSFEYLVIQGVNDSSQNAKGVAELLKELNAHVNVIPYNSHQAVAEASIVAKEFQKLLNDLGVSATFRQPRGFDIDAACGMLAAKG